MKKSVYLFLTAVLLLPMLPSRLPAVECGQTRFNSVQVPGHPIIYQDKRAPEWKKNWDQARQLYQQKKYDQARVQYELLLARKNTIEQARWEYVTILMRLEEWQKAETELSVLFAQAPDRPEYLLARAEIALGSNDFAAAADCYARLYEQQQSIPVCKEDRIRILSGYISALEGAGKIEELLPLLEELVVLNPGDYALCKKTAAIAMAESDTDRALQILTDLEKKEPADYEVLQGIARIQEALGNTEMAARYWQQVIGLNSRSREGHAFLINYYHRLGNLAMASRHLEALLLLEPDNSELRAKAARLHLVLRRPDRALEDFNVLLSQQPGNREFQRQKEQVLHEIAAKLFVLIENNGLAMLWQDLIHVTGDRIGIYRAIADMLRERSMYQELIKVLLVLHHELPADDQIRDELIGLLKTQGLARILASSQDGDSKGSYNLHQ
jgi:tetratricopeptide (TPR) repeat protein